MDASGNIFAAGIAYSQENPAMGNLPLFIQKYLILNMFDLNSVYCMSATVVLPVVSAVVSLA